MESTRQRDPYLSVAADMNGIDKTTRPFPARRPRYESPAGSSILPQYDMNPDIKRHRNLEGCTPTSACECAADRISKLSDTTLVHILSLLNVKEAAQCDVLSSRWMGLWKRITRLDFDASKQLNQLLTATPDEERLLRGSYRTWVNQVLILHKSPTVDEFRVQFKLDPSARDDIDHWIKCAISKRAKKLHVDLNFNSFPTDKYVISPEFSHYLMSPTNLSDVKYLTSLSLNYVNINGELVEYFLSNCPHLERLDVSFSSHLVNLRIVGPSLRLKYLRLYLCKLESIELCAPKLTTFCYYGKPPVFLIGENPLLSELEFGGSPCSQVNHVLHAFSDLVTQLETLKFTFCISLEREKFRVAEFTKLRQLTLDVVAGPANLMHLAYFIFAAPSLKKFTLLLTAVFPDLVSSSRPRAECLDQRHRCLKEIEVFGFRGGLELIRLLDFLFVNTARLKKVVIDPYRSYGWWTYPKEGRGGHEEIPWARETAYKLKDRLPPGVELVVM